LSADFLSHKYVPPGFEVLIGDKQVCPGSNGGIWNLWWNVQLTDDPEAWDDEIRAVNRLQGGLSDVSRDQRLIRAQMAEFCRVSPLFPESVELLCEEIGAGNFSKPYLMGCEGRGLLQALGYYDEESRRAQRRHVSGRYAVALKRWLHDEGPETPIDIKLKEFLGERTDEKRALVEGMLEQVGSDEPSMTAITEISEATCRRKMGDAFDTRARPLHCFECPAGRVGEEGLPGCPCSLGTVVDVGLLCTRVHDDWRSVAREYRRFPEEYVLAYSMAVNGWLEGSDPDPITSAVSCRYVTDEIATSIPERVNSLFGERDDTKVWLASCLLKTLTGNQRWHDVKELIDDFPEATSWLARIGTEA